MSSGAVAVVGATGFIGSALLRDLVARGERVRGIHRGPEGEEAIRRDGGLPFRADLLDPASLRRAFEGCSLVYHAGGLNSLCPKDPGRLFDVNVRGSVNVIEAAAAVGVRRVVYTSSAATIGEAAGSLATEESPHRGWFLSTYEHSKYLAERRVMELGGELGLEVVCLNPSSVQGPGRTAGTARFLIRYAQGRLHWMVKTRVSLLAIEDCVLAHRLAAERGVPGRRHLLNGATLSIDELLELATEVTGTRHKVRYVPVPMALGGAFVVEELAKVSGRRAPLCREMVKTLLHGHAYDGGRAAAELGFSYTPAAELLRRTFDWYRAEGLLPPG
ncbi:MAG: NAD-dependent epimerase/dehydratase family protein [Candidatus Dormiibacterota bacterium]